MATSAKTLQQIIDTLCDEYKLDKTKVICHLSTKELLPAKLTKSTEAKKVSLFASKQAEELASQNNFLPEEAKGSAKEGRYTVADVKKALKEPLTKKILASPNALVFANENQINISDVVGTGKDGRILLKDVQKHISEKNSSKSDSEPDSEPDYEPDSEPDSESDSE